MALGLGRAYTVSFVATSVSAVQDLFYIKPAADKVCLLEGVYLANVGGTADAGDAQEELLRIEIIRLPATVTVGSGGTAQTPRALLVNDAAAGFTARTNDTTVATTSGTAQTLHADGVNVRVPYVLIPPPEHRIAVANAEALVVRLQAAPADAISLSGTLYVRELP
ncbi:MAG: hypothetical protein KatS3mg015_2810 [Fimbriimonadales bacterium]|nr:MAG: hypothetical protein KatS3mg015_2810 [Fimbriimonadales bacterium]